MTEILTTPITSSKAWTGKDFENDDSWIYNLDAAQVAELEAALAANRRFLGDPTHMTKDDFVLPALGATLDELNRELEEGRGFLVIRGIPVDRWTLDENRVVYWGMASHLGQMIVQDNEGGRLHDVYDAGASYKSIQVRGYTTSAKLTPHCDSGDFVSLLCIRPAKEGGMNTIASFHTVYNKILEEHPEYLEPLCRGFHYNIRGGGPEGTPYENITKHRVPVYSYHEGQLSGRYNQKAILTSEELPGVEPITDLEKDAINFVTEAALREDVRFDLMLSAGDWILLNNNDLLHTRAAFVDWENPEKRRWLLRLWINTAIGRPLADDFADHYNTGPRQGPAVWIPQEPLSEAA